MRSRFRESGKTAGLQTVGLARQKSSFGQASRQGLWKGLSSMPLTPKIPTMFEAACKDCSWSELQADRNAADEAARAHAFSTYHSVRLCGTDPAGRLYLLRQYAPFERALRELPPNLAAAARARRQKERERAERNRQAKRSRALGNPIVRVVGSLVRPGTKREAAVMEYHHKVCSALIWARKPLTAEEIARRSGLRLRDAMVVLKDRSGWAPYNRRLVAQKVAGKTVYSYTTVHSAEWPSQFFHTLTLPVTNPRRVGGRPEKPQSTASPSQVPEGDQGPPE